MKVSEWQELEDWYRRVSVMQDSSEQHSSSPELASTYKLKFDLNHIKSLSCFDARDLTGCREFVEQQLDIRSSSRDPEVFPLWDPGQLLKTSQHLLLKAITFQAGYEDGSGSDDASITSDGDYGPKYVSETMCTNMMIVCVHVHVLACFVHACCIHACCVLPWWVLSMYFVYCTKSCLSFFFTTQECYFMCRVTSCLAIEHCCRVCLFNTVPQAV